MITEVNKEKAKKVLEEVLDAFHEKRYKDVYSIVDKVALEGIEEVLGCIEAMIDPDAIDRMSEESDIEFYEFEDGSGFSMDCPLTCCGDDLNGVVLVLDFAYEDNGIKSILQTVDVM